MRVAFLSAVAALSVCSVCSAGATSAFKMLVNGRAQVSLARQSQDQTMVHALDEFVAYMNAALKTTDYNGRSGVFRLNLAIAGDGSCRQADETMAKFGHSLETLGREGFLLAHTGVREYMLCDH